MTTTTALYDLEEAADKLQAALFNVDKAAIAARVEGATWEQIGTLLGITKQRAHQKYAPMVREERATRYAEAEATGTATDSLAVSTKLDEAAPAPAPAPADTCPKHGYTHRFTSCEDAAAEDATWTPQFIEPAQAPEVEPVQRTKRTQAFIDRAEALGLTAVIEEVRNEEWIKQLTVTVDHPKEGNGYMHWIQTQGSGKHSHSLRVVYVNGQSGVTMRLNDAAQITRSFAGKE